MDLKKFATETRNENSMNLDRMSALEIVTLMNQEDRKYVLQSKKFYRKLQN